jgi:hypothetical protein
MISNDVPMAKEHLTRIIYGLYRRQSFAPHVVPLLVFRCWSNHVENDGGGYVRYGTVCICMVWVLYSGIQHSVP